MARDHDHDGVPMKGLGPEFTDALRTLAEGADGPNWWRDVLAEPRLQIAVRREGLDVYFRGSSVFRVSFKGGKVVADTHIKYLVRDLQTRVALGAGGLFAHDPATGVWDRYDSPGTLASMITAARKYAGEEKTGVHELVRRAPHVVDVEVALADPDGTSSASANRIDVASLNEAADGSVTLVFHEAKSFGNGDLRASGGGEPKVLQQMRRYEEAIAARAEILPVEYARVAGALVAIDAMRRPVLAATGKTPTPLNPAILHAAEGGRIDVDPKPRLVVIGFDSAQWNDREWQKHLAKLQAHVRIFATGKPDSANAFR